MEIITVSKKTVEEAITEACIQLGLASTDVEVEVIEKGSAGFLGIGAKQAVIKAWKKVEKKENKKEVKKEAKKVSKKSTKKIEKVVAKKIEEEFRRMGVVYELIDGLSKRDTEKLKRSCENARTLFFINFLSFLQGKNYELR